MRLLSRVPVEAGTPSVVSRMYAPFHSSRAVCTPGRCSGAWSLLFYKKGTCLSRGFHQLFTKEWGGRGGSAFPFFSAPYPPNPLPRRGRGRIKVFLCKGASPLASPALNRLRHSQSLPNRCPAGGLPCLSPANPAFGLLSCPLAPRPPSPAGKGENQSFLMQGASPLASPALDRLRHLQSLPLWCPQGEGGAEPTRHLLDLPSMSPAGGLPPALPARRALTVPTGGVAVGTRHW